jgi:hypothetical protein
MKTIVGSFDSFDEAKRVARDLMDEGFRDSDVNVVASNVRGEYSAAGSTAGLAGTSATTGMTGVTGATTTEYTRNRAAADSTLTTDGGGLTDRDRVRDRDVADDASGAATGAVTGGVVGGAAGLAASLMGLAIPGIGPIIAAGPIVATLSGAGVGAVAGGLIGGLTDLGVSKTDAEYYAESVRRGGALVTVRADDSRAERAADIMRDHGAIDIEHRADQWKQRGWTGWNEKAAPYTTADLDRDRDLYGTTDRTTGVGGMSGTRAGAGDIGDRSTSGAAADRGTIRGSGTRTY